MKRFVLALALAAIAAPASAASTSATFAVGITVTAPGSPPPPGTVPSPSAGDLCVSQALSDATGGLVRVVCRSGQFVSIEPRAGSPYLGVHGGAFRYYFANGIPVDLRYVEGRNPWVGPGTVTSIRVNYLEDMDGIVEMQVGF